MKLKKRAIKQEFLNKFKNGGEYAEITEIVKKDNSLIMCLRGDNVCIYYKCLRILKINQNGNFELNQNYSKNRKEKIDPNKYTGIWTEYFKDAKELLDNYKEKGDQLEKAVQQAIFTENNYSKVCNDTDYFIIDVEYEQKGYGRFDALAVHWPKNKRKNPKDLQIAFIEIKAGNNAVDGKSGVSEHYESLIRFLNDIDKEKLQGEFCSDIEKMIIQIRELGLWKINNKNKISITLAKPQLIYIMIDYNPNSELLSQETEKIINSESKCQIPFKTLFATSSLMGYGLFDRFMIPVGRILKYLEKKNS